MESNVPFGIVSDKLRGGIATYFGREVLRLSYVQLAEDVARAREHLSAAGLEPGACVGLMGENCYEWIVCDLAVLSLQCVVVALPVDEFASKPVEELAERYDLALLLVTKKVGKAAEHPWLVEMNPSGLARARVRTVTGQGLRASLRGTDVCTVIFSSGTSGKLKALLLSRAGVEDVIETFAGQWDMSPADKILVALPLSIFQQRVMVYAALRRDSEILLSDSTNLFRSFKTLQPTIVLKPPALFEAIEQRFHALPEAQWRERLRDALGGRARLLLTGSAPSKLSTLEFYRRSELPLFQAYGLAEIGFIAWNRPGHDRLLSVGRPILPGSVELAEDGEIIVDLPHRQAVGYFGVEPAEQALTFIDERRVATGDLGRFDDDGFLFITGRKKEILITHAGVKIQPEPLEATLAATAGVERAVLLGGGDLHGLVAVVAIGPECSTADESAIRAETQRKVELLNQQGPPAARIIRCIVTRVAFTSESGLVTRNLKVDRRAVYRLFEPELLRRPTAASVQRA